MKQKPPSYWAPVALVLQLGFTISIPIAGLAIFGHYLDGLWHTGYLCLLLGLLLGLIVGISGAYRLLTRSRVL